MDGVAGVFVESFIAGGQRKFCLFAIMFLEGGLAVRGLWYSLSFIQINIHSESIIFNQAQCFHVWSLRSIYRLTLQRERKKIVQLQSHNPRCLYKAQTKARDRNPSTR